MLTIRGGRPLQGEVRISGSKNSILPIMAASLMSSGEVTLLEVPDLDDISVMAEALKILGAGVRREQDTLIIDASQVRSFELPEWISRRMRASNLVMGALLARCKQSRIGQPGGCAIGSRPMDLHLKGFRALGYEIKEEHGIMEGKAVVFDHQRETLLDVPSVGATENIMMAAAMTPGLTILRNAAREPEIVDLQNFLNLMGAKIKGAGTDTISIQGVDKLIGAEYKPIPDRIEAGTFVVAAAISRGYVKVENIIPEQMQPLVSKLKEMGVGIKAAGDSITVSGGQRPYRPADVKTMPYPGFPTDMQPQIMTLLATIKGTSIVVETIFENRFMHVPELRRMGADISLEGRVAIIKGNTEWQGAAVESTDLRAGAALILGGIFARGETQIGGLEHIDRGYDKIHVKLAGLGAEVNRATRLPNS